MYQKKGYEAIGISDHRIYFNMKIEGLIHGCEYNCYLNDDTVFHLLAIDAGHNKIPHGDQRYQKLFFTDIKQVQQLIDELKSLGNMVFIAHPKNPLISLEYLSILQGYDGIELFNTKANSDATDYFHELLLHRNILGIAVDDCHDDESLFYKNYIVLEDDKEIASCLKFGYFYSSNGAEINEIRFDEHTIEVDAKGEIEIFTYNEKGFKAVIAAKQIDVVDETAFRVVCTSKAGIAYSNKIVI